MGGVSIMRIFDWRIIFFVGALLSISCIGSAVSVEFHGSLIDNPPCNVGGQPIDIQFGDIGVSNVDGQNYLKNFSIDFECGDSLGDDVQLYIEYGGVVAPFDSKALQTNTRGLGIRLSTQQGELIPPQSGMQITASSGDSATIFLSAVPVKDPNVILLEGPFEAVGTVEIQYP
ncbi:fimbrial protein [Providencia sp. PROV120]|uniref:fimbrial protein n=1 Tax=Providencia sp. PROV120 TaxID=2949831 RepID=UPI00234ABCAF|nr:fimbrial protein [Providencia sp. PROV120]